MRMLPPSSLTVPDVQVSRVRFFMEEPCSRRCSDGRSGRPAEGDALYKASAPFDTDPMVSSAHTAQWCPSSESADRCLGAKAADRLLEICDRRGCAGRSRDNGRVKTNASPF